MTKLIRIIGAIDEDAYLKFTTAMFAAEAEAKAITIELSSSGGIAYDALAFAARIRTSSLEVTVKAFGYVASAAVLILAAGDKRLMTKEAWVMVHEDSGKLKGEVVALERQASHLRRLEQQWALLLAERTRTPAKHWEKMHKATTHLNAEECLALGLVDKII